MAGPVVVFEDQGHSNLHPLTYTRPACRLRCGIVTLWEKVAAAYPSTPMVLNTREHVAGVVAEEIKEVKVNTLAGDSALLINGRLVAPADLAKTIPLDGGDVAYVCEGQIVAARVSGGKCAEVAKLIAKGPLPDGWADGLKTETVELPLIQYPWDLVTHNPAQIGADFARLRLGGRVAGTVHESAVLDGKDNIHIAEGAEVHPGAILMAHEGPICIGPDATVMAGAVLEGPISVGRKSSIKILAKIYEGTSIGEFCKVGGEVEESIFQAYSNKQHDGFIGHAFFGEWVNLGADTNNSDLKNNYGNVRVKINGREIDSGSMFVGTTMGDHSKSGINTMFNTGTVVGVGCNCYGAGFPPKYMPSFLWGGAEGFVEHQLDKFLGTAEKVMGRRKRQMTAAYRTMLQKVFELTAAERKGVIG
ncbi:MAG: hypothetical protein GY842_04410 [bacterium]|nr:hypothetical protein [bacterium]